MSRLPLLSEVIPSGAVWQTGGGCEAFGVPLSDDGVRYLMITGSESLAVPSWGEPMYIGIYDDSLPQYGCDAVEALEVADGDALVAWLRVRFPHLIA